MVKVKYGDQISEYPETSEGQTQLLADLKFYYGPDATIAWAREQGYVLGEDGWGWDQAGYGAGEGGDWDNGTNLETSAADAVFGESGFEEFTNVFQQFTEGELGFQEQMRQREAEILQNWQNMNPLEKIIGFISSSNETRSLMWDKFENDNILKDMLGNFLNMMGPELAQWAIDNPGASLNPMATSGEIEDNIQYPEGLPPELQQQYKNYSNNLKMEMVGGMTGGINWAKADITHVEKVFQYAEDIAKSKGISLEEALGKITDENSIKGMEQILKEGGRTNEINQILRQRGYTNETALFDNIRFQNIDITDAIKGAGAGQKPGMVERLKGFFGDFGKKIGPEGNAGGLLSGLGKAGGIAMKLGTVGIALFSHFAFQMFLMEEAHQQTGFEDIPLKDAYGTALNIEGGMGPAAVGIVNIMDTVTTVPGMDKVLFGMDSYADAAQYRLDERKRKLADYGLWNLQEDRMSTPDEYETYRAANMDLGLPLWDDLVKMSVAGGKDPTLTGNDLINALNEGRMDTWDLTPAQQLEVEAWKEETGGNIKYYGLGALGDQIDATVERTEGLTKTYYENWNNDTTERAHEQAAALILLRQGLIAEMQSSTGQKYEDLYRQIQRIDQTLGSLEDTVVERTGENPNYMKGLKHVTYRTSQALEETSGLQMILPNTETGGLQSINELAEEIQYDPFVGTEYESYIPTGEMTTQGGWDISEDYKYSPSGTELTDSEAYLLFQLNNGTISIEEAQTRDSWQGLLEKGSVKQVQTTTTPTPAPSTQPTTTPVQPTPTTPTVTPEDVNQFFSGMQPGGVFEKPVKKPGERLYTPEMLKQMIGKGSPAERATAMQQQKIYNRQDQAQLQKQRAGYTPNQQLKSKVAGMGQDQAGYVTAGLAKKHEGLSNQDLNDIKNALAQSSGAGIFFREFGTEEAKQAAYEGAGITEYVDPVTGVKTYGRGRIRK
ncbi:MAG: hypothetical protein PVF58_14255 [Candidatus Methanofastidiosia archaeon]|jgi:hypothetical protein